MGQKVNPIGLRLGINRTWDSRWYAEKGYGDLLHKDIKLREYIEKRLSLAGISKVVIERPAKMIAICQPYLRRRAASAFLVSAGLSRR